MINPVDVASTVSSNPASAGPDEAKATTETDAGAVLADLSNADPHADAGVIDQADAERRVTVNADWFDWAQQALDEAAHAAATAEVHLDPADPFRSELALTTPQLTFALRLTPTAIGVLVDDLQEVLAAQRTTLGVEAIPTGDRADNDSDNTDDLEEAIPGRGGVRRLVDPLGIRQLNTGERSLRTTLTLLGVIVTLVAIAAFLHRT